DGLPQRLALRQQGIGKISDLHRQLALPDSQIDFIAQHLAKHFDLLAAYLLQRLTQHRRQHQAASSCQGPNGSGSACQASTPRAISASVSKQASNSQFSWAKSMFWPINSSY